MKIAKVHLDLKTNLLDQPYYYYVPDNAEVGMRVEVKFANRKESVIGYITELEDQSPYKGEIKPIIRIIDAKPVVNEKQLQLAFFIYNRTLKPFYNILTRFSSPFAVKSLKKEKKGLEDFFVYTLKKNLPVKSDRQKQVIKALEERDLSREELNSQIPGLTITTLNALIKRGIIEERLIKKNSSIPTIKNLNQREILIGLSNQKIVELIKKNEKNGQVLLLFPDNKKSKTFYKENKNLFPDSLYQASFTKSKRQKFYREVESGEKKIIIGTNASLYLSYKNLKSIFVFNFYNNNYFPEENFPEDMIEEVIFYSKILRANLFLIESYLNIPAFYLALEEDFKLSNYNKNNKEVTYLDLNQKSPNFQYLSERLIDKIKENLDNRKVSVLLLNKKGYYNVPYCNHCHQILRCPACSGILQASKIGGKAKCHRCGFEGILEEICPYCQSEEIELKRFGLEKLYEELFLVFPDKKIEFFSPEGNSKAEIVIGTNQLNYYPPIDNVGMVCAINIDLVLNQASFRAGEIALDDFQIFFNKYNQADQFVQSYQVNNEFLRTLNKESENFLLSELDYRKRQHLPPYNDLYVFEFTGPDAKTVNRESDIIRERLLKRYNNYIEILPTYQFRSKKGTSQRRFIVKTQKESDFNQLLRTLRQEGEFSALVSEINILVNPRKII